ncbi:ATP-binding protein [Roseobacter sp. CCS2]|uniref:ATP-binding protein n=1 Tax=Roseobacter sp. CCS2 TaxID=391593 RepID=UPI0000F401E5|nr:ATP-binding protein [Roseobacter sp. CCS2]EBA13648.1 transposition protein, putative [Roseobacter sp. CCS2]
MIDRKDIHRRLALLRDDFVRNEPYHSFFEQFDRQLQRRRAAQSLDLIEEARAIAVIGAAGSGKTRLVKRVLEQNQDLTDPKDGDELIDYMRIIVPASETMKNLAILLREKLGYESERKSDNASEIWRQVHVQLRNRRTFYIHLDEAQHLIASPNENVRAGVVDRLKTLLNNDTWPVGLILSGTPKLLEMLNSDPQLGRRVDLVKLPAISRVSHAKEVQAIISAYAAKAQISLSEDLDFDDLVPRLIHAGANEFGNTIAMLGFALEDALLEGAAELKLGHFSEAFRRTAGCVPALNIFVAADYLSIDARKMFWDHFSKFGGK